MTNTNKNWIVAIITLIFIVGIIIYINFNKLFGDRELQSLDEVGKNKPIERNVALENIYKNSSQLPEHNTACFPVKKVLCNNNVCENVEPKVFNLISDSSVGSSLNPTFARCDSDGCDIYDSQFKLSGGYVNIQPLDPNGALFKMSLIDLKYVEVATLGLDSYISYGYCISSSKL